MPRNSFTHGFAVVLAALSAMPASAQNISNADRQKMLENMIQADANSDGVLTSAEFQRLIDLNAADKLGRAEQLKKSGRQNRAFKRLDANGDGFLTQQEMQAIAAQANG